MEILAYTAVACILYLFSDWVVNRLEIRAGYRFRHRSLLFFVILMVLAVGSFTVLQELMISQFG